MTGPLPQVMPPNMIDHFYLGGEHILALRAGGPATAAPEIAEPLRRPEEWLAATTDRAGEPGVGPSRTARRRTLLRDVDRGGSARLARVPPERRPGTTASWSSCWMPGNGCRCTCTRTAVRRLPTCTAATARPRPGTCWPPRAPIPPCGWAGPTTVDPAELARRVDAQDSDWMLGRMNRITVRPGDGILVPAGTAHAIGAGVFVAEVQEPTRLLDPAGVVGDHRDPRRVAPGSGLVRSRWAPPITAPCRRRTCRRWSRTPIRRRLSRRTPGCSPRPRTSSSGWTCCGPRRSAAPARRPCLPDSQWWSCWPARASSPPTWGAAGVDTTEDGRSSWPAGGQVLAVPSAFGDWTRDRRTCGLLVARPAPAGRATVVPAGAS